MERPKKRNVLLKKISDCFKKLICSTIGEELPMVELKQSIENAIDKANILAENSVKLDSTIRMISKKIKKSKNKSVISKYNEMASKIEEAKRKIDKKHDKMVENIEVLKEKYELIETQYEVGGALANENLYISHDSIKELTSNIDKIGCEAESIFEKVME